MLHKSDEINADQSFASFPMKRNIRTSWVSWDTLANTSSIEGKEEKAKATRGWVRPLFAPFYCITLCTSWMREKEAGSNKHEPNFFPTFSPKSTKSESQNNIKQCWIFTAGLKISQIFDREKFCSVLWILFSFAKFLEFYSYGFSWFLKDYWFCWCFLGFFV